jgi:uncharacterized protein YsxB (DUF464 family)
MISKKNPTKQQKILLALIDGAEAVAKQTPFILCSGITLLSIIGIQKIINQQVIYNCPLNISKLVTYPTAIGDAYTCVSNLQVYGPPAPLPD